VALPLNKWEFNGTAPATAAEACANIATIALFVKTRLQLHASLHPEEARRAVSKDGPQTWCSLPSFENAPLRVAPQDEDLLVCPSLKNSRSMKRKSRRINRLAMTPAKNISGPTIPVAGLESQVNTEKTRPSTATISATLAEALITRSGNLLATYGAQPGLPNTRPQRSRHVLAWATSRTIWPSSS
jgi:hypothetical protein